MTRITWTEGAIFMAKGLTSAGILGAAFQYLSRETSWLYGEKKEKAKQISRILGGVICLSYLALTTAQLIFHIYTKTSPTEVCNQRMRNLILSLFPQLKT